MIPFTARIYSCGPTALQILKPMNEGPLLPTRLAVCNYSIRRLLLGRAPLRRSVGVGGGGGGAGYCHEHTVEFCFGSSTCHALSQLRATRREFASASAAHSEGGCEDAVVVWMLKMASYRGLIPQSELNKL